MKILKCVCRPRIVSNASQTKWQIPPTPKCPRIFQLVFLSKYWRLIALETVLRRKRDWVPGHSLLSPNLPETYFKVKSHHSIFQSTSFDRESRRMRLYNQRFPKAAYNFNQTLSFRNGSKPHGICSQERISPNPVLNENGFKELPNALLTAADFVKRPLEPVFCYTHLEHGSIAK